MLENITREKQLFLLEQMIKKKIFQDHVIPIGHSYEAGEVFSIIEWDEYNDDLRIILKYNASYFSEVTYWDDEGKNTSICMELTEKESMIIPEGLKALLVKALSTGKSITYTPNELENGEA